MRSGHMRTRALQTVLGKLTDQPKIPFQKTFSNWY